VDRLIALVLLRWRMDLRMLLRARERLVGLIVLVPFLAFGSMLAAVALFFAFRSLSRADPGATLALLSALATMAGLSWSLSPLVAGLRLSETHDVSRLLHFPIPVTTLAAASLLANLTQPMVLAEVPILLAVALATTDGLVRLPLSLAGVVMSFVLVLAAAQVTSLLLHGAARNRRIQDVALFVGLGIGFTLSFGPLLLLSAGGRPFRALLQVLLHTDPFAFSPFAWGVRAAVHGGRGDLPAFVGYSGLALLAVGAAMFVSVVLIHRIHRGALDLGAAAASGSRARMVFAGPIGALVEKDMRAAWRDPALKATLFMGLVGPALLFVFLTGGGRGSATSALFLAALVGVSGFGANAFGLERRGVSLLMAFPVERWRILVGKNLAGVIFRLPGLLAVTLAAVFFAPPVYLAAALTIAGVTMMMAAGVDNYVSILFPIAAPHPGRNPYAGSTRGLGGVFLGFAQMTGSLLLASPFILLAGPLPLRFGRWLWLVSLPLALAGAASVYALLIAGAERLLVRREPQLLERILEEA
jgi:ABC-2 type transport system permease protein